MSLLFSSRTWCLTLVLSAVIVLVTVFLFLPRKQALPRLSPQGIPMPFGRSTAVRGSVSNVGSNGDMQIVEATWEGEPTLPLQRALNFVLTSNADSIPAGTTLWDAMGDVPMIGYVYDTENAAKEIERYALLGEPEPILYSFVFPGTFVSNRSPMAKQFETEHPDVTFVAPSELPIAPHMRLLIIPDTAAPSSFHFAPDNGCGNGKADPDEECDLPGYFSCVMPECAYPGPCPRPPTCNPFCLCNYSPAVCGNGFWEPGEECDDGNNIDNDSCRNDCTNNQYDGSVCKGQCCKYCVSGYADGTCSDGQECCLDPKCAGAPVCGNGVPEPPEQCDDGGTTNDDECSSTCEWEQNNTCAGDCCFDTLCGGGKQNGTCSSGLSCCSYCITPPVCGNHIREGGEQCDDGNNIDRDGCSANCLNECGSDNESQCCSGGCNGNESRLPGCGEGETCCYECGATGPVCGNGTQEEGEQCDDGNNIDRDGCSANCETECGTNGHGQCCAGDCRGNALSFPGCRESETCCDSCATGPVCGNKILESGEQCDDGNIIDQDGCSANCTLETCESNGGKCCLECKGEPGGTHPPRGTCADNQACCAHCWLPAVCGNGDIEQGEQCDDGNTSNNDGCSAECKWEWDAIKLDSSFSSSAANSSIPWNPPSSNSSSSIGGSCKAGTCQTNGQGFTIYGTTCPSLPVELCSGHTIMGSTCSSANPNFPGCTGTTYCCISEQEWQQGITQCCS